MKNPPFLSSIDGKPVGTDSTLSPRAPSTAETRADRVTVVLLTHNCRHRIDAVLDHLESLGVPLIAVDNGSADGTPELLAQHPDVELFALSENRGAAARNVGVEHAATPFVACCDDDGWYEAEGLQVAAAALEAHSRLAVVNARILVGEEQRLDPISTEMAASPLPDTADIPGAVLLGFMAGAVVVRRSAYLEVGGYDPRFFIGGEEETLSIKLADAGWQLRFLPEVVVQHRPSRASVDALRPFGLRNTLWNAWLRRPVRSALRWTVFTLRQRRHQPSWWRGVLMTVAGLPWVLRERRVISRELDRSLRVLDERRFAEWRTGR